MANNPRSPIPFEFRLISATLCFCPCVELRYRNRTVVPSSPRSFRPRMSLATMRRADIMAMISRAPAPISSIR
jgi:hypothetical protein